MIAHLDDGRFGDFTVQTRLTSGINVSCQNLIMFFFGGRNVGKRFHRMLRVQLLTCGATNEFYRVVGSVHKRKESLYAVVEFVIT